MKLHDVEIDEAKLAAFCRARNIRALSLFGSITRDDFGPTSDVDILVDFQPEATPGWEFFVWQDELAAIFGRPVHLCTRAMIHPYLRPNVETAARQVYAA